MVSDFIKVRQQGGICEISLSRVEAKNALNLAMYETLVDTLEQAGVDSEVRAVLLKGEGGCFTSGNDLKDFMQNPPSDEKSPVFRFLNSLVAFEKPLVAAVEGFAIGIGTTLLFHCDLVYAADTAQFQLPFVNLAVVPEAASSLLLPAVVGHARAAELFYFGDRFDASTALELGLINEVLPAHELDARVHERMEQLAQKPPEALRLTKQLLKQSQSELVVQTMQREAGIFAQRLQSPEFSEAIDAFFSKRKPDFSKFS